VLVVTVLTVAAAPVNSSVAFEPGGGPDGLYPPQPIAADDVPKPVILNLGLAISADDDQDVQS